MNTTQAALTGAAMGGAFALAGVIVTNVVGWRTERLRQAAARRAARTDALREQAALAFAGFFAAQHAIEWITWYARHDPDALDEALAKSYEGWCACTTWTTPSRWRCGSCGRIAGRRSRP